MASDFYRLLLKVKCPHLLPEHDIGLNEGPDEGHALLEVDDVTAGALDEVEVAAQQVGSFVGQVGLLVPAPVAVVTGQSHTPLSKIGFCRKMFIH